MKYCGYIIILHNIFIYEYTEMLYEYSLLSYVIYGRPTWVYTILLSAITWVL